ncbi:S26 family signal peptidase [Streptomyces sp. ISL-10]|uniref:S26 family signal peptidase n=1 Tax=Streptomyces sp. ISL-10 TaxID=2819172 RepID=UPI001BEB280E|nr:S26 family signal peptidase [Streptomyces sp. ISL-10]MBT2369922.1 S26 family signal peptidase [Streptomyces sp. ISL-10]
MYQALAVLALLAACGFLVWIRLRYTVVTVDGRSMLPALSPGDRVVVRRTRLARIRQSDIVVVRQSRTPLRRIPVGVRPRQPRLDRTGPWFIKRVAAVPGDPVPRESVHALRDAADPSVPSGRLVLLGDNPESSYDSREHGYFPADRLLGKVVRRLS